MRTDDLFKFIRERHAVWQNKEDGVLKPWTDDPILQQYRFCNVYREMDTQTIWFADNWREPNENDEDLWFAALVFRLVNWHETAEAIGYPVPWKSIKFLNALKRRKKEGLKVYNGAYIVSTNGVAEEKHMYLMKRLSAIWDKRADIRHEEGEDLNTFHGRLVEQDAIGSFIAAQVIADMKYTPRGLTAPDWWTFAASGPGSRRGLNRVMEFGVKDSWHEREWRMCLQNLHHNINPLIEEARMPRLHAQDLQNCLCEFDKYERVRLGEGAPKSKYPGEANEIN